MSMLPFFSFCILLQTFVRSIPQVSAFAPNYQSAKPAIINSMSATSNTPKPALPIPQPICSDEPGTWAYDTMKRRVNEDILQRTYEDNKEAWEAPEFKEVLSRFLALRNDLKTSSKLTMLDELPTSAGNDRIREWNEWKRLLQPFLDAGDTWLTAPWLVAEFYVYRRLIEAIGYWDEGTIGYKYDPFSKQKMAGLESSVGSAGELNLFCWLLQEYNVLITPFFPTDLEPMLARIPNLPRTSEGIDLAASIALWGNKMDLSIWPADAADTNVDIFSNVLDKSSENLLHDDFESLANHCNKLRDRGGGNVDIIVDNAGFELITDLALAQYLVESGIASCVTFQLKSHPTFVSDALEVDLRAHVRHYIKLDPDSFPNCQKAGETWQEFLDDGRWKCNEDNFWVQAFPMWDMTEPLRTDTKDRCDLAFVKGDANYRRLLGDCKWDFTASFGKVVGSYFPCPVNGRFGVVQFDIGALEK
eukprot:scaffold346_cov116-Cylindrotheca_fusiformis.AAC.6